MIVSKDKVVSIEYTLRDDSGEILDSSEGREPLAYLHGNGNIVPGLELQLEGKTKNDSSKVAVAAADGYGEFNAGDIVEVPREQFQDVKELEVGMQFTASGPEGHRIVTVTKVEDKIVTVDGNHPLAGKTLHFDVKIVDIRDASADELSHGHVHGVGGHHH